MVFRSAGLLEKHAALLCIGGPVRGGGGGGGVDAKQTRTPELAQVGEPVSTDPNRLSEKPHKQLIRWEVKKLASIVLVCLAVQFIQ